MSVLLMMLAAAATDCGDKPSQTAMTMCQSEAAERADAEMNRTWERVYAQMQQTDRSTPAAERPSPGFAPALLASQRAWLKYRDAECRIESYEWAGGSMQPFTYNQCLGKLTADRTRQLQAMAAWNDR